MFSSIIKDDEMKRRRQSMLKQSHIISSSLARHLISTESKGGNLVFSPLSIHVVLSLIAAGSGGPTRDQLLAYFMSESVEEVTNLFSHLATHVLSDGEPLGGPRLSFANGVLIDRGLFVKPNFKRIVEKDYKSASGHADFSNKSDEVRLEVNAWAEKETNGLIKDLLPPGSVNSLTRFIFANAIYFKGVWAENFESSRTRDHEFYLPSGGSVQVPFMTSWKRQLICAFDGVKVLSLPYKQGQDTGRKFSMHLFLPDAIDGLPSLVEKIECIDWDRLPSKYVDVGKFLVPKFKVNFRFEASEVLKGRGLDLIFKGGGFTEMVDDSAAAARLSVSKVFHKSWIEVNEEGTEAVAATAFVGGPCGSLGPPKTLDFVADHPFLFVVREDVTGVLLFVGQVANPLTN